MGLALHGMQLCRRDAKYSSELLFKWTGAACCNLVTPRLLSLAEEQFAKDLRRGCANKHMAYPSKSCWHTRVEASAFGVPWAPTRSCLTTEGNTLSCCTGSGHCCSSSPMSWSWHGMASAGPSYIASTSSPAPSPLCCSAASWVSSA